MRISAHVSAVLRSLAAAMVTCGVACTPAVDAAYVRFASMPLPSNTLDVLGAGDKFELRVYREADMSGEYTVDDEGAISFPLIGRVPVAGRSCSEIANDITARLAAGLLRDPAVTCRVLELNSLRVVVSGEVRSPGRFAYTPDLTVIEAIALAQGVTPDGSNDRVTVTRIIDGVSTEISVPLQQVVAGRAPNFRLWPGDLVTVPMVGIF